MSDQPPWARETPAERAEARATRRRWITLAELVAVAGVVIAALTLWSGWQDRRADQADRRAEKASEEKVRGLVTLAGTPESDGRRLVLKDPAHDVRSIQVRFPHGLGLPQRDSLVEPRIEADWIAAPLLKLTAGGPDAHEGRLPVLIAGSWWDGDKQRLDRAIYDVVWSTHGRLLRGRVLRLEGVVLRERITGDGRGRLDVLWAQEKPAPTK